MKQNKEFGVFFHFDIFAISSGLGSLLAMLPVILFGDGYAGIGIVQFAMYLAILIPSIPSYIIVSYFMKKIKTKRALSYAVAGSFCGLLIPLLLSPLLPNLLIVFPWLAVCGCISGLVYYFLLRRKSKKLAGNKVD